MAAAVPHLRPSELRTLREGEPVPGGAIAVIAPGTGLGAGVPDLGRVALPRPRFGRQSRRFWADHAARDGAAQAPAGPLGARQLRAGVRRPEHSRSLRLPEGRRPDRRSPQRCARSSPPSGIGRPPSWPRLLDPPEPDPLCLAALNLFVSILGAAAGNLALTVLATGGVYIAGGIPQRILPVATGQGSSSCPPSRRRAA